MLKSVEDQERIFNEQLENCGVEFFDYCLLHNVGVSAYEQACKYDTFGFALKKRKKAK
jgi:predicted aldo/keto reductase-like oxidoreductase